MSSSILSSAAFQLLSKRRSLASRNRDSSVAAWIPAWIPAVRAEIRAGTAPSPRTRTRQHVRVVFLMSNPALQFFLDQIDLEEQLAPLDIIPDPPHLGGRQL